MVRRELEVFCSKPMLLLLQPLPCPHEASYFLQVHHMYSFPSSPTGM